MKRHRYHQLISLTFLGSLVLGWLPTVNGQTQPRPRIKAAAGVDTVRAFEQIQRFGRGIEFVKAVETMLGPAASDAAFAWFDEKDRSFFKAVYEAYRQRDESYLKRRAEAGPKAAPAKTVRPVRTPAQRPTKRRADSGLSGGGYIQTASYRAPANGGALPGTGDDQEPVVTTLETEAGHQTTGELENTIETPDATITKGSNAETIRTVNNSQNGVVHTQTSFEEITNKKTRGRVRNDKTMVWKYLIGQCPDADGVVKGEVSVTVENKATIANTTTIAVPTQTFSFKATVSGMVDDEAELVKYDLSGNIVEITTGYDRARSLGLIGEDSLTDGSRQVSVTVNGNTLGTEPGAPGQPGEIREGPMGHLTVAESNRLVEFADQSLPMNLVNADNGFATARSNWRMGFCVDVALTAPKTKLGAGEQVTVSAESVHKLDRSKINARLEGSGFDDITPPVQDAAPKGEFSVTGSGDEHLAGEITVRSISRRGIGTNTLKFGKEKAAVIKNCDSWSGTISITRRSFERSDVPEHQGVRTRTESSSSRTYDYRGTVTIKNATARSNGGISARNKAVSTLDIPLTGESNATSELVWEDKSTSTYSDNCGSKTTHRKLVKHKVHSQKGTARAVAEGGLAVDLVGGTYSIRLVIPAMMGTDQVVDLRQPSGYCRPEDNEPQNSEREDPIEIAQMGISVEDGVLDPSKPNEIEGSRVFIESNGEEVEIRWRLEKCPDR